ncbi:hypothetical protein HWI79_2413 [Cryptosporidium felis]|nr:hypothetical protein HWI79_2413 [Cryptosporidium felis]
MSSHTRKLVIPSHLRLDSLSLSCISTGLTPKSEIEGSSISKGLETSRSASGQYSDVHKRLSIQLPSCRSLRTSARINRSSSSSHAGVSNANIENSAQKQPKERLSSIRASRINVTTPRSFEFATSERAEHRLKCSSLKSLSSGLPTYKSELNLSLHQLYNGRIPNAPASARSSSSIGAESRISTQSRMTTVPRPFSFATDARAASKSKELCERLGALRERFNEEVLNKNKEFSEEKRLKTIVESIQSSGSSSQRLSLENGTSVAPGVGNGPFRRRESFERRNATIPKTPKFATQLRSESKKAQLRGVIDSMFLEQAIRSTRSASDLLSPTGQLKSENGHVEAKESSKNLTENSSGDSKTDQPTPLQPLKLPRLRGFLSMNSLPHLGRQSFGVQESTESFKKTENSPVLNHTSVVPGMSSIRKINELDSNIPNNWKFQATIARKQLQQFTSLEDTDFTLDTFGSNSQDKLDPKGNNEVTHCLSEEDLKTPLPRTCR